MIITISGLPGSGKSTVGKMLAKKLGYKFYSMGDLLGKMAMERGITIGELNEIGKREGWTDREPDEYQKKLGQSEDNFVIDSRLGFYFIPQSFKVFIEVDSKIGAERVFKNQRPDEKPMADIKEMQTAFENRAKQDDERYQKYYQVSFLDRKNYDLVFDSSFISLEKMADKILAALPK